MLKNLFLKQQTQEFKVMSSWTDLPRRLTTISVAVPIILSILTNPIYAFYLIQISHLICTLEWTRLIPKASSNVFEDNGSSPKESSSKQDKVSNSSKKEDVFIYEIFHTIWFSIVSLYFGTPLSTTKISFLQHPPLHIMLPFLSMAFTIIFPRHISTHYVHGLIFLSLGYNHLHLIYQYSIVHAMQFLFIVWNSDTGALLFGRTWKGDPIGKMLNKMGFSCTEKLHRISKKKSATGMCK